ncbi:hypothetical protein P153DRAFT_362575 [Dothidotthia symphoricarpi CBS 119687]|uniref:BTB domain-containing protein n=1 Tax=Dothidotthia symphoricarpi CBS 119687 TaxID=1392245 RepID=A0A6A6ATE2_9PLEO|nr:uncharacterized protein P153DRAFT_362575 [Dothidotthia symphoricarpi CBS 119687]KAF2134846.1 hypothetical protein P153DRAFT_362575 [Dothidotthia symphoricarpi CBS 119687]
MQRLSRIHPPSRRALPGKLPTATPHPHITHPNTTQESQTRTIRLRDDFPYAVHAMLEFIDKGFYSFQPESRARFPYISKLDYHIHAYLVGAKYEVAALCEHAIKMYIITADMTLRSAFITDANDLDHALACTSTVLNAPPHPHDRSPAAELDRFLDSLVLLWKNTPDRDDAMRCATLRLIKHYLSRLMRLSFFVTLMMQMVDFGADVEEELMEDGFEVKSYSVLKGGRQRSDVRFGEAW